MPESEWKRRKIDAPVKDLLTTIEVAKLFGFGEETLRRLVEAGEFPQPVRYSPGRSMYDWRSVAFWRLKCELFRGVEGAEPEPPAKSKAGKLEPH